jgi:hypothetical protein
LVVYTRLLGGAVGGGFTVMKRTAVVLPAALIAVTV